MPNKYVSLLEYKELRLWGNIIQGESRERVEDIFITNSATEEVVFKDYNLMLRYKDPHYFNLVRDGKKVLMAISFLESLEGISTIQRDMEIKKVCTSSFKKGSLMLVNLYAAKEKEKEVEESSRVKNRARKEEESAIRNALIDMAQEQGKTALLDGVNILILKDMDVPEGSHEEVIHFIKKHKHLFKDRIIYEQEHLDDYPGAIKKLMEELKNEEK